MSGIEKLEKTSMKKIIGVVSGKGGVGKSTTSVLLARALKDHGYTVGILDADITGPSIPRLLGVEGQAGQSKDDKILPLVDKQGIELISVNMFLKEEDEPVIWRGPLLANALKQFYSDTDWGKLDYLIVDFPPGTGDVNLTGFQQLPLDGIVIVATPQDFVSMIVAKSVKMAVKTDIPVLGLVENMGTMVCPHCAKEFNLFSQDGTTDAAKKMGLPLLSRMAWRAELAQRGALHWDSLPEDLKEAARLLAKETTSALQA